MFRTCYRKWVNRIYPVGLGRGRTSAHRKSCRHLRLEVLEQRLTPNTHTWTGNNSIFWSDPGNWSGGSPAGDNSANLEFPGTAHKFESVDNIPGNLFIDNIIFDGNNYKLELDTLNTNPSPSISLSFDITANNTTGTNSLLGMPIGLVASLGVNTTHNFTVARAGRFAFGTLLLDSLSDAVGTNNVTKFGSGDLELLGDNSTYGGLTNVDAGSLTVANTGVPRTAIVNVAAGAEFALASDCTIGSLRGPQGSFVALGNSNLHVHGGNFSGVISGLAGSTLSMDGAGTFTLAGPNTYSGSTQINSGTLAVGAFDAIPRSSAVTVNLGATLSLNGFADGIGSLTGAGSVNLGSKGFLATGSNGSSTTFSGVISGTGGVIDKQGSGTFTLGAANTFTGATDVEDGTLQIGNSNAIPAASDVFIFRGTLDLHGKVDTIGSLNGAGAVTLGGGSLTTGGDNKSTTYSGIISGSGNLVKSGTGTFILSGANIYSGRTNIAGGVLRLGANNAIPATSSVTVFASVFPSATLDVNNFNDTIGSLTETLFFSGKDFLTLGQGTLTTGADNTSSNFFSGVISGTGGLTKIGTGTFVLAGNNTYSGATTVQAGTLFVDGSCGNVIVNGGTLSGFGTVASIAANGGTVNPGTNLHSTGFVSLATGSTFQVQLNSNTNFDQLSVGGPVILNGTPTLSVSVAPGFTASIGQQFKIITAGVGVTGTFNGLPNVNPPATFTASGQQFQIQYFATSVVLTRVAGTQVPVMVVGVPAAAAPGPTESIGTPLSGTGKALRTPLDAGAVDSLFASTQQDAHGGAALRSHRNGLAWANDGLWDWVSNDDAVVL